MVSVGRRQKMFRMSDWQGVRRSTIGRVVHCYGVRNYELSKYVSSKEAYHQSYELNSILNFRIPSFLTISMCESTLRRLVMAIASRSAPKGGKNTIAVVDYEHHGAWSRCYLNRASESRYIRCPI